jgi:hypothetical protein
MTAAPPPQETPKNRIFVHNSHQPCTSISLTILPIFYTVRSSLWFSVGRNFCVHTPVCHASWVLNGVRKRDRAFFCLRVVAFPGQQNLRTSGCIPPKRSQAASAPERFIFHCRPPSRRHLHSHSSYFHLISMTHYLWARR